MTELEYLIFIICGVGLAYTSYRIGWREGSGAMVDYVKSKRNRAGYTTMHFFGDKIEFADHLEQMDKVLNKIADRVENETKNNSRKI